ncbi:DUF167 domain-containing protein [Luteimicrobium sp. DT211]|uniref:DUF167 domain-containing protein n=1 Tax=Luteimicrobium sp. DT211 TaxID=3393412 RepID=UPI003CF2B298
MRVRPGASRTRVGGRYGDDARLVVAVSARAVDGKATRATLDAVADALGIRPRAVTLVSGATSRDKLLEIDPVAAGVDEKEVAARLTSLLDGTVAR